MNGVRVSKKGGLAISIVAAMGIACIILGLRPPKAGAPTRRAHNLIAALRSLPASPLGLEPADERRGVGGTPAPDVLTAADHAAVRVTLPGRSTEPLHVEDAKTGLGVDVQLRDVSDVVAQSADGYFVYPHAHVSGGTPLHRELQDGAEDFVSFETRPPKPEVTYDVAIKGVQAVRLVEGAFELLADGAPRLRAAPPFIVGADGERTDATVAVENCAVNTDPAGPWGRDLVPPGSGSCTLRIRWDDAQVKYPAVLDPRWQSTQNMTSIRQDFTATMMSTGKVLAVGGRTSGSSTTGLTSAELYDPVSRTWATTISITGGRYLQTATQLGTSSNGTTSGKVFVAGGLNAGSSLNTAQLYSPSAGTWTAATNLPSARSTQAASLLASGKVLLAGGVSGSTVLNTAVVYDPSSGTGVFTATGNMPQAVKFHSATLLKVPSNATLNNKVLVVGGNNGSTSVTNIQLFDGTSAWSSLTPLSSAREGHTATALANGNVLVAGGRSGTTTLNTTLLFNAASGSGTWSSAGNLTAARQLHSATLLSSAIVESGQVLVAGGSSGTASLGSAEVWNGTSTWTATAPLPSAVQGQTATLLTNNLVLLAGGANGSTTVATAMTFDGSFALQCTANSQCATGFCSNGVCCDTACNAGCGACNLTGHIGTCTPLSNGTVCRASAGTCDVAETCNGTAVACPADTLKPSTTVCRAAAGECDVAENCTGTSGTCPIDTKKAAGTVCTDDANPCTVDQCNGTAVTCQHPAGNPGAVCRAQAGACDVAETCTGTSATCPADFLQPASTVCRASAGVCDVAENCTGNSASCPADTKKVAGTACTDDANPCTVDQCDGTAVTCQHPAGNAGAVCRAQAGACDVAETCTGTSATCPAEAFQPASTVCRAKIGQCDVAETCTGNSPSCPADQKAGNGTACSDGNVCTQNATCQSGQCQGSATFVCHAPDACHDAGTCNGNAAAPQPPSTQNLIGWWKLEGDGHDSSGGGNDLTIDGTVTPAPGRVGLGMKFDGAGCMSVPAWSAARMAGSTGLTMMAWVNTGADYTCPTTTPLVVMGKGLDYSTATQCSDPTSPDLTGTIRGAQDTTYGFPGGYGTVARGTWTLVTITWDQQQIREYFNGSFVGAYPKAATAVSDTDSTFNIGCMNTSGHEGSYFFGTIDEALLYSRPLSDAEIAQYYAAADPCVHPVHADGSSCSDGNACNGAETCQTGTCQPGPPLAVDDANPCTADACDPSGGATHAPVANGTLCDDGTPATRGYICQAGVCGPVSIHNLSVDALGTLGGSSSAQAVNASGQVVGQSRTSAGVNHAFLWTVGSPMIDIGSGPGFPSSSSATAVSTSGNIAGSLPQSDQSSHAFSYGSQQQFTDLGVGADNSRVIDPFSGFTYQGSYGYGVNDSGQVVGTMTSGGEIRGFVYTPGQGFADIGALGTGWTWATGIARDGTVVGSSQVAGKQTDTYAYFGHAIVFKDGGLIDLNDYVDPTAGFTLIRASAISDKYIVGNGQGTGPIGPFRFDRTKETEEVIPTSWAGDVFATAVNNVGEVVGFGLLDAQETQQAAFIYSDQLGFRNLNDLLPTNSGWNLQVATGINDSGDIVGWGYYNGALRAFRLRVSPETVACQSQGGGASGLCVWVEGVADKGGGHLVAVFGFQNSGTSTLQPTTNQELINGVVVANPSPPPPTHLPPGNYPGAFVASLGPGDSVSWSVNGQIATAYAPYARQLTSSPIGSSGVAVEVEDTQVVLVPDTGQWATKPPAVTVGSDPPHGDPFFGSMKGGLTVSASGAAIYTVPITIPPGVGGMAPSLNLVYNSQGPDGIAGQGWSLTGLSIIHRCPKNRIDDAVTKPVVMGTFDGNGGDDGICMDGQRMFQQPDGSFALESAEFSKITVVPTHLGATYTTFSVRTKGGQWRYYGLRPESRVTLPSSEGDLAGRVAVWALDRVEDSWGNYYDLHYNDGLQDFSARGLIATSITYTGHHDSPSADCGNTPTNICPPNIIRFDYESRPDGRTSRFHKSVLPLNQRLASIRTPIGTYGIVYFQPGDTPDEALLPSRPKQITYSAGAPGGSSPVRLDSLVFTWDQGGYLWTKEQPSAVAGATNSFELPVSLALHRNPSDGQPRPNGVQFADLDGDGRVDLIQSRDQQVSSGTQLYDARNRVWHNTGSGWEERDDWALKATLVGSDGKPKGILADVDGDGMVDLVAKDGSGKPVIYFNHIRDNLGWIADGGGSASTFPAGWGSLHLDRQSDGTLDSIIDMDGDGMADIVRLSPHTDIFVLNWNGTGWAASAVKYNIGATGYDTQDLIPQDVNRDGVPDLVATTSGGSGAVLLNIGATYQQNVVWYPAARPAALPSYLSQNQHIADLDGDGFNDILEHYEDYSGNGTLVPHLAVQLGTGTDFTAPLTTAYADAITSHQTSNVLGGLSGIMDVNGDGLIDVLERPTSCTETCTGSTCTATCPDFGQLLINTGYDLRDPTGASGSITSPNSYSTPFLPDPNYTWNGNAVVDLDGDGLPDLVKTTEDGVNLTAFTSEAWRNKFHRPVITGFPNGLAAPTEVGYATITRSDAQGTGSVYDDTMPLAPNTKYMTAALTVVSRVGADAGLADGTRATTTYHYSSMRASATGHGPVGFGSVSSTEPAGSVTITNYVQSYPFVGLPASVTKLLKVGDGGTPYRYSQSSTNFCAYQVGSSGPPATWPTCANQFQEGPGKSYFVYPAQINDTSWLLTGTSADRTATNPYTNTATSYTYDDRGNPTGTQVVTTLVTQPGNTATDEQWWKTIQIDYGQEGTTTQLMGKPLSTTVSTWRQEPSPLPRRTHVTSSGYAERAFAVDEVNQITIPTLALNYEDKEDGAGFPVELATAYGYDPFGNVTTRTECDNAFSADACTPGAPGPATQPYRTTTVSYYPTDFVPPSGSGLTSTVPYEAGRFPVKKTNALGHTEYLVFDPNFGAPIQATDPNGITTCYHYDALGTKYSEVARCGSVAPITTSTLRYRSAVLVSPAVATVAVTSPPDGRTTWVYADVLGREVATFNRSFSGGLIETLTDYTPLGQLHEKSQPFNTGDPIYWTTFQYDGLNRMTQSSQDLGAINSNGPASALKTFTFQGNTVTTTEHARGESHARTATKNALGKVSMITDAASGSLLYGYDADGNLASVQQNALGSTYTTTYGYDNRGRKTSSADPDMGSWQYTYDGFGDLLTQTDALAQVTSMTYDALGRMLTQTDGAGTSEWVYDQSPSGPAIGKLGAMIGPPSSNLQTDCPIPLVHATGGNRAGKFFYYDRFMQLSSAYECVDGVTYNTGYTYDPSGRANTITYPTTGSRQLTVGYNYTPTGYLQYVSDASDGSALWVATAMNALGEVTTEYTRNGVSTVKTVNPATGWLSGAVSTAQADANRRLQVWSYQYDEAGDLMNRHRLDDLGTAESDENFGYDSLNRLTGADVSIPSKSYDQSQSYGYDSRGNLTTKGASTFKYGTQCGTGFGLHQLCSTGDGSAFVYDANGNMTSGSNRTMTYDAQNRISHIGLVSGSQATADFAYGADGNRVVQILGTVAGADSRTYYIGLGGTGKSLYEMTVTGSTVQHTQFIYAGGAHGGNAFALQVVTDAGTPSESVAMKYNHFDHLGSVTEMSDESGHVVTSAWGGADATQMGYDVWGARRNPDESSADPASFNPAAGHRGFTDQETIPSVGVINMNGRVYDPAVGRFLTADPNVQDASDLQSYNRYSYALNNPLKYTDPTGYFAWGATFSSVFSNLIVGVVAGGACVATGPAGCMVVGMLVAAESTAVAASEGASWSQITLSSQIGFLAGNLGGSVGQLVAAGGASEGAQMAQSIISGYVAGVAGAAMSTALFGGNLGENLLVGAAAGALGGGVAWGVRPAGPVTVAEAEAGGGSGEADLEALLRENSTGRSSDQMGAELDAQLQLERAASEGLATEDGAEGHSGTMDDAGSRDAPDPSKRHTPDQEAVVDLAKQAKARGGVTRENADTLVKWGKDVGFKEPGQVRGPENHGDSLGDHIHVGGVDHIKVLPSTSVPSPNPAVVGGIFGVGVLYYLWPILAL